MNPRVLDIYTGVGEGSMPRKRCLGIAKKQERSGVGFKGPDWEVGKFSAGGLTTVAKGKEKKSELKNKTRETLHLAGR